MIFINRFPYIVFIVNGSTISNSNCHLLGDTNKENTKIIGDLF
jgi:hypothetical protein